MPIIAALASLFLIGGAFYIDTQVIRSGYWVLEIAYGLSLCLVLHVLMEKRDARGALAWILLIVLLPLVGGVFYALIGNRRVHKPRLKRRLRRLRAMKKQQADARAAAAEKERSALGIEAPVPVTEKFTAEELGLMRLATASAHRMPVWGNKAKLLLNGPKFRDHLLKSIANAKSFIHFEYFIFRPDEEGRHVLDALERAAARGVEVRLLLDAAGSWTMRSWHLRALKRAGGKVAWFFPINPFSRPLSLNLRNHRKIAIFDGSRAYMGGLNIANEYLRRQDDDGVAWFDAHLCLDGPCVEGLSEVFAEDWMVSTEEDLSRDEGRYFPRLEPVGEEVVQIVECGPDQERRPFSGVVFSAIALARDTVRMATPYFSPDEPILQALRMAALRGARVKLLLPGPRHGGRIMHWCARWHYDDLLEAGVEIYEYNHGFLHSKMLAIDGAWSVVGTTNMDERSFRLNFEVNALLYSDQTTRRVEKLIDSKCRHSDRVSRREYLRRPFRQKLLQAGARLIGPQL